MNKGGLLVYGHGEKGLGKPSYSALSSYMTAGEFEMKEARSIFRMRASIISFTGGRCSSGSCYSTITSNSTRMFAFAASE
jgi:hypothetical protein